MRRPVPRDRAKILGDCRDLALHRLTLSFTAMLDRVAELLMARAERSDIREEQTVFLDARELLLKQRAPLMAEFEQRLRNIVDERIEGKGEVKQDFATVDAKKLTLVDISAMDESVLSGNITRIVENLCSEELSELTRAMSYLMGRPELENPGNPLAPAAIVTAFTGALRAVQSDQRINFAILKEVNQGSLADINAIYADLNRHLQNLQVVPKARAGVISRGGGPDRPRGGGAAPPAAAAGGKGTQTVDLMELLQRIAGSGATIGGMRPPHMAAPAAMPGGLPPGGIAVPGAGGDSPYGMPAGGYVAKPMNQDALGALANALSASGSPVVGQYGGPRILVTPELGTALNRLQQGETGFDVGGVPVQFSGVPQDMHNVLRDLQESPIAAKANQLEAMTIELVAMLFDFIFETKDLPDGIKALIGRLQIPVLKAAMLDGAFFSKKTHPSRLLVNALAHAGIGWSPSMGHDDPLYKKIESIVHRILDDFSDDVDLFDTLKGDLEAFLREEEERAEANIQSTAEEINQRDRQEISRVVAKAEIERRLEQNPSPNFLALFLRAKWMPTLATVYQDAGEESEMWRVSLGALDDLVWSVQPKRNAEDRRRLVTMLPNLLRRLHGGLQSVTWEAGEREQFMSNLVEAHAAAVKPSLASVPLPTVAVAQAAQAAAREAQAKGDEETAAKARALAEAMSTALPPEPVEAPEIVQDHYADLAGSLERGVWIEFEGDDGQLNFAKLAWVSPLRGTYLFTNRQGQKAVSLTADELALRFRNDRARLVEAEPLVDRAFSNMMAALEEKFAEVVA